MSRLHVIRLLMHLRYAEYNHVGWLYNDINHNCKLINILHCQSILFSHQTNNSVRVKNDNCQY